LTEYKGEYKMIQLILEYLNINSLSNKLYQWFLQNMNIHISNKKRIESMCKKLELNFGNKDKMINVMKDYNGLFYNSSIKDFKEFSDILIKKI